MLPHDAYSLCREGIAQIVVLVVEVVIGFEPEGSLAVEQVFQVKIANEIGVTRVVGVVAVTKVAVEQQAVVEQLARQGHIHLHIAEVTLIGAHIGRNRQVVGHLAQNVAQLPGNGR